MSEVNPELVRGGSRLRHYLVGTLVTPVGTLMVLGAVVVMNELSEPPEKKEFTSASSLEVRKPPPPKPKQQVRRPKPKPKSTPRSPPPPSLAALTSGLSGISVDLPQLQLGDLQTSNRELLETSEEVTHTADTVDEPPQPTQRTPIDFPPKLRQKGVNGYVLLSILVAKDGSVERVKVLESKPPGTFDSYAIEAVRGWSFQPGTYKGEPVKTWARQKIVFELRR